ncbi:MAG: hypothetical protein BalsKO_15830 [Balneolaceae bacterium]
MGEVYAQDTSGPAPDGFEITNTATATYVDTSGEIVELDASSNTVVLIVQYELDMLPDNLVQTLRGRTVSLTHILTNNSDEAVTIDLSISNDVGDDFDLQNIRLTNTSKFTNSSPNKAIANSLETIVSLVPGESFEFTYSGEVDQSIEGQIESIIQIIGVPREGGNTVVNTDTIRTLNGTKIDLVKNLDDEGKELQQGDTFTYTLRGENTGDITAYGKDITLDGFTENKVVLLDSVPANLTFTNFESLDSGIPFYHTFGSGEFEFLSVLPPNLEDIDVIGVLFDSIAVGHSFDAVFRVKINDGAIGQISNVAFVDYLDSEGDTVTTTASDSVMIMLEGTASINYFTDDDFLQPTSTSSIGQPLFIQANASLCNESTSEIERVTIEIASSLSGDLESFIGIETGRNTGVFQIQEDVPTRNSIDFPVVQANKTLEVMVEDELVAELKCAGLTQSGATGRVTALVVVDVFGVVYDSESNDPVAGATVQIIDVTGQGNGGNAGGLADTYAVDGTTPIENAQITGDDGRFTYPFVFPSTYRIEVIPPDKYNFPSEVGINFQPVDREIDSLASYGLEFTLENTAQAVDIDIPIDGQAINVLFSDKKVDKTTAEVGDYLNYSVEVRSEAVNTVRNLVIEDKLPLGFEYVIGTARVDDIKTDDPIGGKGPTLTFNIDSLETGNTVTVKYRVLVGPGAQKGDGINTAIASSDELIARSSNRARVEVEIRGGVFSDDGYIFGKVFTDFNRNDIQDGGDIGIPGVRLYMENGTYVITDVEGNYTMYGVKPNKHVLKLDNTSLPKGATLSVLDNRHANDPSSRFVDLKKGEFHRADFAICNCDNGAILEEVQKRIDALRGQNDELQSSVSKNFSIEDRQFSGGSSRNQASGIVGAGKTGAKVNPNMLPPETAQEAAEIEAKIREKEKADSLKYAVNSEPQFTLEELISDQSRELDFLNIADGDTISASQMNIWVKSRIGAVIDFYVNGEIVPTSKIGKQVTSKEGVLGYEYVGIDLKPGKNAFQLLEIDPFGNKRGDINYTIFAPGELSNIKLKILENDVPADGISTARVRVELVDEMGIRIGSVLPVTLDISEGAWEVQDLNANEPGTQIFIENGFAEINVRSTIEPKRVTIRANAGVISQEEKLRFVPDLRPLIAAGIIEGTLRLNQPLNINSASDDDGFERELKALAYEFNSFKADARIAFFLKGKVRGDMLLTAGYDSEKAKEDRLFRDINPDEYYPVYGESSIKGFDAQTSGRLYIRLDKGRTYAMYGDFITQERDENRQLGDYSRSQTGIKANFENELGNISAFTSQSATSNRVREFQAEGLSRYTLPDTDIIENSEIIELVTYDREQPEVIIGVERLTRFKDYILEDFSGTLIFTTSISSIDEQFNPVFIRAIYEVENTDEKYFLGGINGSLNVTENLTIGAGVVQDNNPENKFNLASANIGFELGNTEIIGEVAQTTTDLNGTGRAGRVQVQHRGKLIDARAQVGKSGEDFANTVGTLGQGRTEARAKGKIKLSPKTSINTEVLYSVSDTSDQNTIGGTVDLQQNFQGFNAQVGMRYSRSETTTNPTTENTNLKAKVTSKLPFIKNAAVFGEFEQDLNEADRRLIAVGGDYRLLSKGKVYARHEFISSAAGLNTLNSNSQRNNTVFGIKTNYMKNGEVFSEYRVNDAFDGPTGQAAIGLKNSFQIKPGFNANAGFERQFTVKGPNSGDATAVSGALSYTANPNWKGTTRAEARFASTTNTYLNSFGYGQRITANWTLLTKNIISLNTIDGISGFSRIQERFRVGAAFRDIYSNKIDGLFRYEYKYEKQNSGLAFVRKAHVFSSHGNYHPVDRWTFSGRLAAKSSTIEDDVSSSTSFLELISGRIMHDINDTWDAGINASLLANSDFTTKDYGLGLEVGFLMARNLRLAVGYNIFGYEDEDLADNSYSRQGVYAGFSYKFDEQLFDNLLPTRVKGNKPLIDKSLYMTCEEAILSCVEEVITDEILTMPITKVDIEFPDPVLTARDLTYEELRTYVLPRQIHFDNDKSYINEPAAQMLDKVASYLMNKEEYILDLSGFTDSKSSNEYNKALALRRALAARAYLIAAGMKPDQMTYESLGEEQIMQEELNRVEMALNRRVEVYLDDLDRGAKFINQVEDIQVNKRIAGINGWDYIFNAEHDVLPSGITLKPGSTQLNEVQVYYIERIAMALKEYKNAKVRIALPVDERLANLSFDILDLFNAAGIPNSRVEIYGGNENGSDEVSFSYLQAEELKAVDQNDDVKFANNARAIALMKDLLVVLNAREDYELLRDRSQTYTVPDRLYFGVRQSDLDNETEAAVSRVGSYLRSNEQVYLELRGTGTNLDSRRANSIKEYLINWGISGDRIRIMGDTAKTTGELIHFEYRNADKINLLSLPENLKGGNQRGGN